MDNKGDFLIENITEVQLSGYTNKVAKLHLDNGECIVSTQNHRYLTRLGEYKEVKDLCKYDELKSRYLSKGKCLSKSDCYKVVKVELIELSESIPVYDLSVKESTPCFLLSSGIVSHNTIPSGSDIKNIYTSRYKGGCIFAPDYSQMEIRCIAGASKCTPMLEAFKNGADIHMENACKIFRKPAEEILPAERRYAKMSSFMILYGGDYKNFAEEYLDGDLKLGKYIYDSFYEAYPEIKTWIDERHEQMRTTGKVTTPMDYYINVSPEKYGGSESKALRAAQNYPISNIVA